ncbi:tRNA pseudouridine synthase B [Labilithrix luteola]|uniref:tRNA pseudouridine synthase B n=1 Tax=Labilithrix luteola TaxID=1391654 RepID=A0A0K1Q9U1_9BACT|nr:tRNA pseudouridine(55) synthase TruB [Labilithrix luteola]AKV02180.1 tRNA pseudouridine synthase B [Labilithrix luteola]
MTAGNELGGEEHGGATCTAGVLVVDKPKGPTSHDVVAVLRRALQTRQIGHCGTLDPMATGVLVVTVDEATKLVPYLTADDKAYETTVRLGVGTDSLDAEGQETARQDVSEELREALVSLERGEACPAAILDAIAIERARSEQVPPAFSAVRIGGERAHTMARRGEAPELAARPVALRSLEVRGGGIAPEPHLRLALDVTKGYFVRSLARDLSAGLGTVGHLTALRRTRSGGFTLDDALSLEGLWEKPTTKEAQLERRERLLARLLPMEQAVARAMPTLTLTDDGVRAARHGQRVRAADMSSSSGEAIVGTSAWLDASGKLVAIGEVSPEGSGQVLRGFVAG